MNTKYTLRKRVLALTVILLASLSSPVVNATYNASYLTPAEVKKLNREIIAREQALRVRRKQLLIAQERKKQLKRAQLQRLQAQRLQQYPATYQQAKEVPAWRRSANNQIAHSDDAVLYAAKTRNLTLLKQLIAEGANINHKNFDGESALHIAASLGNIQMVQFLVSQRANVNDRTRKNWLPIHHAIRFNHPIVANYLIAHRASIWTKNSDGFSALDFASKSNNVHINAIARKYGR